MLYHLSFRFVAYCPEHLPPAASTGTSHYEQQRAVRGERGERKSDGTFERKVVDDYASAVGVRSTLAKHEVRPPEPTLPFVQSLMSALAARTCARYDLEHFHLGICA